MGNSTHLGVLRSFLPLIILFEALRMLILEPSKPCEAILGRGLFAPSLFPLLEPPETKPEPVDPFVGSELLQPTTLAEIFRHSGWQHNRRLIYDALRRTTQSVSRILSFENCGATAFVFQSIKAPFDYRVGGSSCRDRFCVPCARDRSRVLTTNVLAALAGKPVRFLTLTLKTNDGPLSGQIDRLYRCFTALRARAFWRKRVSGGCAFTEVKWSPRSDGWNVHIHCLLHGLYIPKRDLWRAWWAITGDSMIVDVKLVRDQGIIGRYVTKYVAKPMSDTFANRQPQLDELIRAMVGRRLCITFGDWRGVKLTQQPEPGDWINIGSFHDVLCQAYDGDAESLQAVRYICGDKTDSILAGVPFARPPPTYQPGQPQQLFLQGLPESPYF